MRTYVNLCEVMSSLCEIRAYVPVLQQIKDYANFHKIM